MKVYRPTFTNHETGATEKCSHWYITFEDNMQVRRRLPAFSNKQATDRAAVKIDELLSLGGVPSQTLQAWLEKEIPESMRQRLIAWGIVDSRRVSSHLGKSLAEHVEDFRAALGAKGRAARHVKQVAAILVNTFAACGFKRWADLDANRLFTYLGELRAAGEIGQRTFNSHLRAAQHFCKWMTQEQRASSSPLLHLSGIQQTEKKVVRRALDLDEQRRLLAVAEQGPAHHNMTGHERALAYRLALETGLRANEIRMLTVAAFNFKACVVTLAGAYTKNKQLAELDLKPELTAEIEASLADKSPDAPAFRMPNSAARMIRKDLDAARAKWIAEAQTDRERGERERSDFLAYYDFAGRVADFHALRHTFITNLARAGVHPSDAQALARHSTITLTMDCYTHTLRRDHKQIINALPDLTGAPVRLSSACPSQRSA